MSEETVERREFITLMLDYDVGLEKLLNTNLENEGIAISSFNTQGSSITSADEIIPEGVFIIRRTIGNKFYMTRQTIKSSRINTLDIMKEDFQRIRNRALQNDPTFAGRIYFNSISLVDIGDETRIPRMVVFTKNIHLKEEALRRLLIGKSQMPLDVLGIYNCIIDPVTGEWIKLRSPITPFPQRIEALDVLHYTPNVFNSDLTKARRCTGVMKDDRIFVADSCEEIPKDVI